MMTSILIADDDKEIVDLVKLYLQNEGYTIHSAYDGAQVWEMVQKEQLDLVVLDIMMPKMDGLEVCRLMRQEGIATPILMLSAKAEDNDKIMGLLTGADDYMVKPFNPLELSVRVKAILRRVQMMKQGSLGNKPSNELILGPIVIDRELHTVMVNEKELHLTTSEFDILFLLAHEPGRVFSSELIFERIWQEKALGASKTVMVHISNLRDKLKDAMDGENVIKTIWGVGYKIEV